MKEIKTNQVLETKIRNYNAWIYERLKTYCSTYEDKVLNKIPEEICISLLNHYQKEKETLQIEITAINNKLQETKQKTKVVEKFLRRVKNYIEGPILTREMAMELIEFVTIDKFPQDKSTSRTIHI